MSPVLNVGIVGTGIFARETHLPAYEHLPQDFKVVAAFNRTKSKAEKFAEHAGIAEDKVYDSLDEMLADKTISFIDALLPAQFNADTVEKCIAAGKPIILEKPIAATIDQARKVVKLAESTPIPVAIAENWLFLNAAKVLKEQLAEIGPITAFTYNSTGPFVKENKYLATSWRQKPEHIGGFLSDGGVHQLALLTEVLGEVSSLSAFTKQVRKQSGTDDVVFSTMKMKTSDVIGTFTYGSAFGLCEKSVYFKIYGLNGAVTLNLSDKKKPYMTKTVGESAETKSEVQTIPYEEEPSFGVHQEFLNFHEAVAKKEKGLIKSSPRVAFHHLACVAAFLESSSKNGDNVVVVQP
ncbi:LANO_0B08526g1_1 [Lachancea nothofagi CBS 11611]|uniref:LANO_0B08526g1_1 n=1 Tax=Lachancea nothofagi CBS 11611 TaxID=1266666 RepID=A0A1G4J0R3_9SACH|nr:LANO_0B08526g1_1 [Lachancea nothofagi CBS 11611]